MGAAETFLQRTLDFAPTLALILGILLVGIWLSFMFGRVGRWIVQRTGLETLGERFGTSRLLYAIGLKMGLAHFVEKVFFFTGLLITLLTAAETAGLSVVAESLLRLVGYLPQVLVSFGIVLAGLHIAEFARGVVSRAERREISSPDVIGTVVYYVIVALAFTIAADQLGLEITLINGLIQILVAAAAASMALAFALGARTTLGQVVARFYAAQLYQTGDTIEIIGEGEPLQGTVIRFSPTGIMLQTESGSIIVPCEMLMTRAVRLHHLVKGGDSSEVGVAAVDDAESTSA